MGITLPWLRTPSSRAIAWGLAIGLVVAAVIIGGIIVVLAWQKPDPCAGEICGEPPISPPRGDPDPYTSPAHGYALDATGFCSIITVSERTDAAIRWNLRFDDLAVKDWPTEVRGEVAAGRSAQVIVEQEASTRYAGATFVYSIPLAEIGFQRGYGAIYDLNVGAGNATPIHARAIVMASVKGDLAIILSSLGPWTDRRLGHPNPASTVTPICFSAILTSVTWPGEPPP